MAGPFEALERGPLEEAVEGTVRRLFRPDLQPIPVRQGLRASDGAASNYRACRASGTQSFRDRPHPDNYEPFGRFQTALQGEIATYLTRYARDRGWQTVALVEVHLGEDETLLDESLGSAQCSATRRLTAKRRR